MRVSPPPCPECGSRRVHVVITRCSRDNRHILRRRHCHTCDHRWYTLQDAERIVASTDFTWVGRNTGQDVLIHERPKTPATT
jgi:transcriptional regulator NrdR family protein